MNATRNSSNNPSTVADGEHLLKIDAVLSKLAISRATLYKCIAAGHIPAPRKLGSASRWRASDIASVMAGTFRNPYQAAMPASVMQ